MNTLATDVLADGDCTWIMALLRDVPDPEIPVISIVDLGVVRGIRRAPPAVLITPTYTGCPAARVIEASVRAVLDGAGYPDVAIKTVLSPPWTTDWISDAGRDALTQYGIAPPPHGANARRLGNADDTLCPRCSSRDTREVSRFGSTPCKALMQCLACGEPFDRFKCH